MGMTTHFAASVWNPSTEQHDRPVPPPMSMGSWWALTTYCRPSGSRTNPRSGVVTVNELFVTNLPESVNCTLCIKKMAKAGVATTAMQRSGLTR